MPWPKLCQRLLQPSAQPSAEPKGRFRMALSENHAPRGDSTRFLVQAREPAPPMQTLAGPSCAQPKLLAPQTGMPTLPNPPNPRR